MSLNIFPSGLIGQTYPVTRRPKFNNIVQRTLSNRVIAATYTQYPYFEFDLSYEYLSPSDLKLLEGFFLQQGGNLTPFYFDAGPGDDAVTMQKFATGDGATTAFRLMQENGGFLVPVYGTFGTPIVYTAGYGGDGIENLLTYSQQLDNAAWAKVAGSLTPNATTAPDGTNTAGLFIPNTTTAYHLISHQHDLAANTQYTLSVYAKAGGYSQFSLMLRGYTSGGVITGLGAANVDLAAGTVTGAGATITPIGSGWYRVSATGLNGAAGTTASYLIETSNMAGDGVSGYYLWGGQLESGTTTPRGYLETGAAPYTWTIGDTGFVTFAVAPPNAADLKWSGNYYYRCRFAKGSMDFDEFMNLLYQAKTVNLVSEYAP